MLLMSFMMMSLIFFSLLVLLSYQGFIVVSFSVFLMDIFSLSVIKNETMSYFLISVILVTLSVFYFSRSYMHSFLLYGRFLLILLGFVGSMLVLLISSSYWTLFLGWDGLGLSSFFLVAFYSSWTTTNSAMITVLSNRVGDGMLLLFFSYFLWDNVLVQTNSLYFIPAILVVVAAMSKSAQYPFCSWLPFAMAAPTPVSALVHSSTLVTAGVILLLKFVESVQSISGMLMCGSMLTIFWAGLMALGEKDFKKLVALSTLSQVGLMFLMLSCNLIWLTLLHLISHAFFKSLLFIIVGSIMHNQNSNQDWRLYNLNNVNNYFLNSFLLIPLLCLCGLSFTSGFVTKDFLVEHISDTKLSGLMMGLLVGMWGLTFLYSFLLFKSSFYKSSKIVVMSFSYKLTDLISLLGLAFLSISFGWWSLYNLQYLSEFVGYLSKEVILFMLVGTSMWLSFGYYSGKWYFSWMKSMDYLSLQMKPSFMKIMSWLEYSAYNKVFVILFDLRSLVYLYLSSTSMKLIIFFSISFIWLWIFLYGV